MKRLLVLLAVMLAAVAVTAPTASAGTGGEETKVCPVQTSDEGATLVDNGDGTVTVTVEEGFTLTYLCLKAGSEIQGCGPAEFDLDLEGPAEQNFDIPCDKELSHFGLVTELTAGTTTGGGGGEDTTSTSTTGGGGAGGGGGGGGAGGGGGSGELPFTGLPVLIPLLLGGALLASGAALLRRGRQED